MVIKEGPQKESVRAPSIFLLSGTINALCVLKVAGKGAEVPDLIPGMLEAQEDRGDVDHRVSEVHHSGVGAVGEESHHEVSKPPIAHPRLAIGVQFYFSQEARVELDLDGSQRS